MSYSVDENRINGILEDEMGLGKPLQEISLPGYLYEFQGIICPHMVVALESPLCNWRNKIPHFCHSVRAVQILGNQDERIHIHENLLVPWKFDLCVTSFEMAIKEKYAPKCFD